MDHLSLKPPELTVNPSDPWCDDKLNRKNCADRLTEILLNQPGSLTVSLNGKWGSGKTYLLKRWQQDLLNAGYVSVYYNAWEDDSQNDPLVSILAQLWQDFGCNEKINLDKEVIEKLKSLLITAIAVSVKYVTGAGIDLAEAIKDISNLKDWNNLQTENSPERQLLAQYLQGNKSKMIMRDKLNELAQAVYNNTNQTPLVFIVDELDRCRPTFAIETLERIKHLFCIDHVIFVLGIDQDQLGLSIQSIYGNIDVENYLHRFIDLDLLMPDPDPLSFFDWLAECEIEPFAIQLLSDNNKIDIWREFKLNVRDLVCNHNFSLREIEHFFIVMRWMLNANKGDFQNAILLAALVVLKISNPTMYLQYINLSIAPNEVIDFLIPENSEMDDEYAAIMACMIYYSFLPEWYEQDNVVQKQIAQILSDVKAHNGISKSPYCAKCLIKADKNGVINDDFSFHNQKWLWDSGRRSINQNLLKKLSHQLEMDFLNKPEP